MTYCPHDDDPLLCPPCQNAGRTATREPARADRNWSAPFDARYEGRCDGCYFDIRPGQSIRVGDITDGDGVARLHVHDDPGCIESASLEGRAA